MESEPGRVSSPAPSASPVPYGGPVPPGGWHEPVPPRPVPGELAGWWRRAAASLIDGAIVSLPATLLGTGMAVLIAGPAGGLSFDDQGTGVLVGLLAVLLALLLVVLVVFATALVYAPVTMRRAGPHNGQTWGKQLLGIRVARMSGEPTTFASAAVREVLVKFLLFGMLGATVASVPTILDLLWPLWDGENRALHDMVVDTRVVRA